MHAVFSLKPKLLEHFYLRTTCILTISAIAIKSFEKIDLERQKTEKNIIFRVSKNMLLFFQSSVADKIYHANDKGNFSWLFDLNSCNSNTCIICTQNSLEIRIPVMFVESDSSLLRHFLYTYIDPQNRKLGIIWSRIRFPLTQFPLMDGYFGKLSKLIKPHLCKFHVVWSYQKPKCVYRRVRAYSKIELVPRGTVTNFRQAIPPLGWPRLWQSTTIS